PKMLLTPTYHVYRMYVPFQGATVMPVSFEAGTYASGDIRLPQVDAVAARDSSGKIWLSLVNIDPNRPAHFTLDGIASKGAIGEVLTGAAVDAHNSFAQPAQVAPRPCTGRVSGGRLE